VVFQDRAHVEPHALQGRQQPLVPGLYVHVLWIVHNLGSCEELMRKRGGWDNHPEYGGPEPGHGQGVSI
jgi:hypothetical protein